MTRAKYPRKEYVEYLYFGGNKKGYFFSKEEDTFGYYHKTLDAFIGLNVRELVDFLNKLRAEFGEDIYLNDEGMYENSELVFTRIVKESDEEYRSRVKKLKEKAAKTKEEQKLKDLADLERLQRKYPTYKGPPLIG